MYTKVIWHKNNSFLCFLLLLTLIVSNKRLHEDLLNPNISQIQEVMNSASSVRLWERQLYEQCGYLKQFFKNFIQMISSMTNWLSHFLDRHFKRKHLYCKT